MDHDSDECNVMTIHIDQIPSPDNDTIDDL